MGRRVSASFVEGLKSWETSRPAVGALPHLPPDAPGGQLARRGRWNERKWVSCPILQTASPRPRRPILWEHTHISTSSQVLPDQHRVPTLPFDPAL